MTQSELRDVWFSERQGTVYLSSIVVMVLESRSLESIWETRGISLASFVPSTFPEKLT
jgi:hypothetical protein